jgi:hypothetical protein
MKYFFTLTITILLFSIVSFAQNEGIDHAMISLWEGGSEDLFYSETDFNEHNFGELNSDSTLYLKSGQVIIWKNAEGDIIDADMYYRVYVVGETPSDFVNTNLPWNDEWDNEDLTMQLWWNESPDDIDLNLLDGIADGEYVVEVYFQAENGSSEILDLNNGTLNYKAYFTYSSATKISETSTEKIAVFPNPVYDNLSINIPENTIVESLEIIDCTSNVVYSGAKQRGFSNQTINIPIDEISAGIYFIRLKTNKGLLVQRVIISK